MGADPRRDVARALREADDLEGAIRVLFDVLGDGLGNADVATELATMLADSGQLDRAEGVFRHALKLAPEDRGLRLNHATFLGHSGELDASRLALEAIGDEIEGAHVAAVVAGRESDASDLWDQLALAECNLARTLLELGEVEEARRLVLPWMVDASGWDMATEIMSQIAEVSELDEEAVARELLDTRRASPGVIAWLVDLLLFEREDPVGAWEVLTRADGFLFEDWAYDLDEVVDQVRATAVALRRMHLRRDLELPIVEALEALEAIASLDPADDEDDEEE